ncbi:hypothetical protein Scep_022916 [Stephania cephalantha]|uniref:Uncharacterized protein n=1 Tax=Stephania cephalantha TaxID=152367 RepID=A0AAP0F8T5_9MAGN
MCQFTKLPLLSFEMTSSMTSNLMYICFKSPTKTLLVIVLFSSSIALRVSLTTQTSGPPIYQKKS